MAPTTRKIALGPAVAIVLMCLMTDARADEVDDLAPGTWYEIPDTPMREVCPPDTADYDWSFFCRSAIGAWSGGALDTSRGRLIIWGGGHADYRGNEVYTFDLQALQWERVWGPTPDGQIPTGGTHEEYDDGNPGSRHTYSGLAYVPPPVDSLVAMGGSLWQSGFYGSGTWAFSFTDNAWTRLTDGPGEMGFGDPMVYDPETGNIFRRANSRVLEFDPVADTFTDRAASDGGFWATDVSATLDPIARTMVIVGDGRLDLYHLDTDTYEQDVTLAGPGVEALFGGGSPGVGYDAQQESIVVWGGGLDVYTLDLDEMAFSLFEGTGDDPGAITPSGGAFGRFRYAPSRNVFVSVNHVDENVFVFRMSEGEGVPPDPPPSGDSGDSGDAGDSGSPEGDDDGAVDGTSGGTPDTGTTPGDDGDTTAGAPVPASGSDATGGPAGAGDESDSGCACRSTGRDISGAWLLLALVAVRRRARDANR